MHCIYDDDDKIIAISRIYVPGNLVYFTATTSLNPYGLWPLKYKFGHFPILYHWQSCDSNSIVHAPPYLSVTLPHVCMCVHVSHTHIS